MAITNGASRVIEFQDEFEVIVVGAGHAGCEAALASARLGCKTLLLTLNLDKIAWQPCNPAVGGPAKSQLTLEPICKNASSMLLEALPSGLYGPRLTNENMRR
jgi:choline dehydrogenase-like flavoprotein